MLSLISIPRSCRKKIFWICQPLLLCMCIKNVLDAAEKSSTFNFVMLTIFCLTIIRGCNVSGVSFVQKKHLQIESHCTKIFPLEFSWNKGHRDKAMHSTEIVSITALVIKWCHGVVVKHADSKHKGCEFKSCLCYNKIPLMRW